VPLRTKGLAVPSATPPSCTAIAIASLRGSVVLRIPAGHAWDIAFVGLLDVQWRSFKTDLAKLTPDETDRLANEVVKSLQAQGRIHDAETARLAAYAVRCVVERARETSKGAIENAKSVPAPPQPPPSKPAPAQPAAPQLPAMADNDATIKQLRALYPAKDAPQSVHDMLAMKAQGIVDRRVRYLMEHDPKQLPIFVKQLWSLGLPVARLPVSFRDGWSVAVSHGKVMGTINAQEPYDAPRIFGQHYRFGLHDITTGKRTYTPVPVDIDYTFADATRTVSAGEYAQTLIDQQTFVHQPGWPKGGDPFNLTTVRDYFQKLCDSGTPMSQVFGQWQAYLSAFYVHANSADLQGRLGALGLGLFDTKRLTNDMQGVVNDMLPATTGQRLLDCEFFAGLSHYVFSRITKRDGSPRFDAYWIALDTHEAQLIVERGPGARAWGLTNNNEVRARGTTTSSATLAPDIISEVGRNIFWGNPAVFGLAADHDKADKADRTMLNVPAKGAYIYDGKSVSTVTEEDQRAFYIYVATRKHPLDTKHREFIESWRR